MERRGRTGNKPLTNKERQAQWQEVDGLDLSEVPALTLRHLMKLIREKPRGDYGPEHDEVLAQAHSLIRYSGLDKATQAGLIVSATKDIVGRGNRTPEA